MSSVLWLCCIVYYLVHFVGWYVECKKTCDMNNTKNTFLNYRAILTQFQLQRNRWGYNVGVEDPGVEALIYDMNFIPLILLVKYLNCDCLIPIRVCSWNCNLDITSNVNFKRNHKFNYAYRAESFKLTDINIINIVTFTVLYIQIYMSYRTWCFIRIFRRVPHVRLKHYGKR